MRIYGFNAPQERIEPRFYRSTQDFTHVNTGRFVRNAVLSGMCYGGNDLVPSYLKTCDAVHPLCGTEDFDGVAQSCYGALLDSVNNATTKAAIKSVCQPWNTSVVWAPGGTGVDAWLAVKLPEATLVERYVLVSTATTCPLSFKIQGSLDGSTWADLHTVENSGVWESSYTEKVFTIPEESRGSYLWYRFYVTASNAATMSIRNFRLWRAQSVCDRGQLRLDASAGNPLLLSFMNGFATDGVTPVDYGESLSAAIVQALGDYDSEGLPISGAGAVPVDIFAKRDASGSVVVSVEAASSEETEYFAGGMKNWQNQGFVCSSENHKANNYGYYAYQMWGYATSGQERGDGFASNISRIDGTLFFVRRVLFDKNQSQALLYVVEADGTTTNIDNGEYSTYVRNLNIDRYVKKMGMRDSLNARKFSCRVFSASVPYKYRIAAGKVYQQDTRVDTPDWSPVQKIKIASAVYDGTDLYQLQPRSSLLMQWMTRGDNVTYLDA